MAKTINGESFIDVLDDRRKHGDFNWIMREWSSPSYRFSSSRTPSKIKEEVLSSAKVDKAIKEVSFARTKSYEEIQEEAKHIIDEMGHNFQLKAIRFFGYLLAKTTKRLYNGIYVNQDGVDKMRSIADQYPILLMPTHRSYADFLLVSYLCFHFNLPLPVIAAGLDFLGLKAVSTLLRNSGAFFIRRSFGDDKLYWAIFSEYVQTHIKGGEAPLEFFVEGTRSRTAKSLVPRLGLLQVVMDLFFTASVPDITIIPISISYDRTLEETLYAYELLGVPKPKESTKGLLKARGILQENYGNVYVRFGEPISAREFCGNLDRRVHNLTPRFKSSSTSKEQTLCSDLASHVIRIHHYDILISPFPLVCLFLGHSDAPKNGIHINQMVIDVIWLKDLIQKTGATVVCKDNGYIGTSIQENIKLHSNIIGITDDEIIFAKECQLEKNRTSDSSLRLSSETLKRSLPQIFLYHYGNQALQLLIHPAMIALAMSDNGSFLESQDTVYYRYNMLRKLLEREFVFEREKEEEDYSHALQALLEERIVAVRENKVMPIKSTVRKLKFLGNLLNPFLESYFETCQHLLSVESVTESTQSLAKHCQNSVEASLIKGEVKDCKSLSLDVIHNCILLLISRNAIKKNKAKGETDVKLTMNRPQISLMMADIDPFLPARTSINVPTSTSLLAAKL